MTSNTAMTPGLILVAERHRRYYAAESTKVLDDGKVEVRFRGPGSRMESRSRGQLKLRPRELDQSKVDPALVAIVYGVKAKPEIRIWQDATMTFKMEGKRVSSDEKNVVLETADGQQKTVPLAKLCAADRQYVAPQRQAATPENPFKEPVVLISLQLCDRA